MAVVTAKAMITEIIFATEEKDCEGREKRYADLAHSFKSDSHSAARDVTSGGPTAGQGQTEHASTSGHVQL